MSGSSSNSENRSLLDELRGFDRGGLIDLGHPLLNRIAESFVIAAGVQVSTLAFRQRSHALRGTGFRSSEVKNTGKESMQWGLCAGMYSGLTYGLKEARGVHDWKNSAVAGAITGAALALTSDESSHEQIVQCAITGAAISTAANLLAG
ncbi:hypothetical protein RJ639_005520, partial [Escallonia herrerae]